MTSPSSFRQRTVRWLGAPVRSVLERMTRWLSDQSFCRIFPLYNLVANRWPITLQFDHETKLFRIEDTTGDGIYIGRRSRLQHYNRGVRSRLAFLAHEYMADQIEIRPDDLVVDVGANVGEMSMYVALKGARTISIEPEELEFRCLKVNVPGSKAICLNMALWSNENQLHLYSKNDSGDSSLLEMEHYSEVRHVQASTLRHVLEKHAPGRRVRLLKLEAEGAEPEVLVGAKDVLHLIDYITADVGPERGVTQSNTFVDVLHQLQTAGFELIGVSSKRMVLLLRNRNVKA